MIQSEKNTYIVLVGKDSFPSISVSFKPKLSVSVYRFRFESLKTLTDVIKGSFGSVIRFLALGSSLSLT